MIENLPMVKSPITEKEPLNEIISILCASDLHFGIPSVDQQDMANAFTRTIFPLLKDIDIFCINGDFFDTLVIFDNHGFDPIYDTIVNLFNLCQEHGVILRLLQGTWTHDRNQCRRFNTIYKSGRYDFDFKFMEGIQLEEIYVRNRDLRFMYVQDDLPFTESDKVVEVIKAKMIDVGWDHVDYGCMHGFFDFTAGGGMNHDKTVIYTESQFDFVRKAIDVGHVHQHRIQGKVISNGSFDRAVFGDEGAKGAVKILDYPDHYTAHFIENKHTAIYDTLTIGKAETTESIIAKISSHVSGLVTDRKISLRFVVDLPEHRDAIRAWMKEIYPDIRYAFKKNDEVDDKTSIIASSDLLAPVEKRAAPTPETIAAFIRSYIPESYILSVEEIERHLLPISK